VRHLVGSAFIRLKGEALKWNEPGFYWMHINLAAIYGKLRRRDEAQAEVATLLRLYPDFPRKAREEVRIWFPHDRDCGLTEKDGQTNCCFATRKSANSISKATWPRRNYRSRS